MQFSTTYSRFLAKERSEVIWSKENTRPFDELILSWNGLRPKKGAYHFEVSVKCGAWSKWLSYAKWGMGRQETAQSDCAMASSDQDIIRLKGLHLANGFRMRVRASDGSHHLTAVHACASQLNLFSIPPAKSYPPVHLPVRFLYSQRQIQHPRCRDMCSPTSLSMAIDFLLKKSQTNPLDVALCVHDQRFDLFGNWTLNVAEGSSHLHGRYFISVRRLKGLDEVHRLLSKNLPVIVSIQGPLPGSYFPYLSGHLMMIAGISGQHVIAADPAAPDEASILTPYGIEDFLEAWGRRRNLAYVFTCSKG